MSQCPVLSHVPKVTREKCILTTKTLIVPTQTTQINTNYTIPGSCRFFPNKL